MLFHAHCLLRAINSTPRPGRCCIAHSTRARRREDPQPARRPKRRQAAVPLRRSDLAYTKQLSFNVTGTQLDLVTHMAGVSDEVPHRECRTTAPGTTTGCRAVCPASRPASGGNRRYRPLCAHCNRGDVAPAMRRMSGTLLMAHQHGDAGTTRIIHTCVLAIRDHQHVGVAE